METTSAAKLQQYQKVADELTHLLADSYVLYLKTQNFHWNVTGPLFPSLHLMFESQYKELAEAVDEIAERIRALGSFAPASFSEFSKLSSIKEERKILSAEEMLKTLLKDHEALIGHMESMFKKAESANDQATMDLLIERIRAHEKTAWMLRSSIK
ncbi:DNA starvation/stationary phase protection protein [Gammaproteobacteria bacterium SCGC AG-212-F23]|nr:DNA starvation/stationary phase protection protein [Gammaproteobacteria bacterium SCGC AG-212-F23]